MKRLARLALLVAAASAATLLHAQTTGNLYELPDYQYFEEPAPAPTPAATPTAL